MRALLLCALLAGCGKSAPPPLTPAEIASRAMPSVAAIKTPRNLGSGFVIEDDLVATNRHVIVGAREAKVHLPDGRALAVHEVVAESEDLDLAIVRVRGAKLAALRVAPVEAVHAGEPVVAIGHPFGLENSISNGLVSAVRTLDRGVKVLQISAPISPGSSGGPLLDARGDVIGVATFFLAGGQALGFAVPASYLRSMKRAPVPLAVFGKATAPPEAPEVERHVPIFPVKILEGCEPEARARLSKQLESALEVAAPIYNAGDVDRALQVYEWAASELQGSMPATCGGAVRVISEARMRSGSPAEKAWTLHDTFEALLQTLSRIR